MVGTLGLTCLRHGVLAFYASRDKHDPRCVLTGRIATDLPDDVADEIMEEVLDQAGANVRQKAK